MWRGAWIGDQTGLLTIWEAPYSIQLSSCYTVRIEVQRDSLPKYKLHPKHLSPQHLSGHLGLTRLPLPLHPLGEEKRPGNPDSRHPCVPQPLKRDLRQAPCFNFPFLQWSQKKHFLPHQLTHLLVEAPPLVRGPRVKKLGGILVAL